MDWAVATLATAIHVAKTEGDPTNVFFTIAVIGAVAALATAICRRILLSTPVVAATRRLF